MNHRLKRLMHTPPGEWARSDLLPLSVAELSALAELLGIPKSGTHEALIERLLLLGQLRAMLAEYDDPDPHADAERMCEKYSRPELHSMCASAKIWKAGNKKALAIGLISWRNECRRKGKYAYQEALKQARKQPFQRRLFAA